MANAVRLDAGRLQRRISLQTPTDVTDPAEGTVTTTWATYHSCWADIEPLTGRELMAAAQIQANLSIRVTMRYKSGVRPRDRILYGSRLFQIHSIADLREDHVALVLLCEELSVE